MALRSLVLNGPLRLLRLAQEIGPVGVEVLRAVKARIDPAGVLNPGVMVP